jgi:hypothetical protein
MTTFTISGSITTNDPISASYVAASNVDGVVSSASHSDVSDSSVSANTASYVLATNISGKVTSATTADTASYVAASSVVGTVANATSASYAATASVVLNAPVGGINGMAYFTASTTWTVPSGITKIRVIAIGGGGGGAGGNFNWPQGHGAGGGGYSEDVISVAGYSTIPITVGVGGLSGTIFNENNGTPGSASGVFNVTASGGDGASKTGNGVGGSANGGTINVNGQTGNNVNGGASGNLPWVPFIIPTSHEDLNYKGHGAFGFSSNPGQSGVIVIHY